MFPALQVPRRAVRLGQRVLVMPRVMLHRCCTSAAASTHVSPSGFAVCTAGLEPIFWQKTPFLGGSYLSFGKSKNFFFFFLLVLPKVLICRSALSGAGLAPLSACSSMAKGMAGVWEPPLGKILILRVRGGWLAWSASPRCPARGVPKPPAALSPLMHLFKYWVIVFSFWQR